MDRPTKLVVALALVLTGCGPPAPDALSTTSPTSLPTGSTTTTEAVERSAVFDFSAIAGRWSGLIESQREGTSGRFPVELSLDVEARRGSVVGSFRYPDTDNPCRGTLSVLRRDDFEYILFHSPREGDCNPSAWSGQLRLLHNSETDTLNYLLTLDFSSFSGVLERVEG